MVLFFKELVKYLIAYYFLFSIREMLNLVKSIIPALITALTINGFSILTKPVNAGLFLSPMYLKMESEQGQSKGVLQVGNTGSKPIRVRLSATAFTYNKNGVFQRSDRNNNNESPNQALDHDLTPYLRYSPREMVVPGNSSRRVRLISLLPPSLPEGEYRTSIFAETLQETTDSQGFKVGFNMSIGSALYVAKGETNPDITIIDSNFNSNNSQIKILVNNSGNATAKGSINWTLKQGKNVITSGKSGGSFLPDSQTNIVLNRNLIKKNSPSNFTPGNYQLEGEIIWDKADQKETTSFNFDLEI